MIRIAVYFLLFILNFSCLLKAEVLLQSSDLVYEGAFKAPVNFGYAGYALSHNPANNSLFMASIYRDSMAEISIPALVNSSNPALLNAATVLQSWADPTEGNRQYIDADGTYVTGGQIFITGSLVHNNRLIGSTSNHYPGEEDWLSHWDHSLTLSATGTFRGNYRMGADSYHPNHKAGHMAHIPLAYQSALGGDTITGQNGTSIVGTTSLGPSLWSFSSSDLGSATPIPNTYLVGYPPDHRTLGGWDENGLINPHFSISDLTRGVVFPEGSKTILFFGRHGTGPSCYKTWCTTNYPEYYPDGTPGGNETRPYVYKVWAYNVDDLIAAKNGHIVTQEDYNSNRFWTGQYPSNSTLAVGQTVQPWNVVYYATWEINFPTPATSPLSDTHIVGAAYDSSTQKIYLSQFRASGDEPVIHAYSLNLTPAPPSSPGKRYRLGEISNQ